MISSSVGVLLVVSKGVRASSYLGECNAHPPPSNQKNNNNNNNNKVTIAKGNKNS